MTHHLEEKIQTTGLILIGNELLNGSRQDKHMQAVIERLHNRGMSLGWVRIVGDSETQLIDTFRETFSCDDIVFSFGGIGATPDDLTRQAAAKAANMPLERHPGALKLIEARFGESAYPNRVLMSDLPRNAELIPNPVNQIPGFRLGHHHFVPGFPDMAWPMVEWALDTHYSHLFNLHPTVEKRWNILGIPESALLETMTALVSTFPDISLSSLPSTEKRGELIDFGIKGPEETIVPAADWLEQELNAKNIVFEPR